MMKRLTYETKKTLAHLLAETAIKRMLDEKKCKECKNIIGEYLETKPISVQT